MSNSPYKSKGGLSRIYRALLYSKQGLVATYQNEAAFRQELLMAAVLIPLGLYLGHNYIEQILLIGSVIMVLIIEILNSAVESLADAISTNPNQLIGRAKDQASAAVLISMLLMCIVWGLVLINHYL